MQHSRRSGPFAAPTVCCADPEKTQYRMASICQIQTYGSLPPGQCPGTRIKISFPGYTKLSTLKNFPALIILGPHIEGFSYSSFRSIKGFDLRFYDITGRQELNYETEKWDSKGRSYVWVQVPALRRGTVIWASWGTADPERSPAYTRNGATWDNGFRGVWHHSENGASRYDSTRNRNTASANGTVAKTTGGSDGADDLGTGGRLQAADSRSLDIGAADFTLSVFAKTPPTGRRGADRAIISKRHNGAGSRHPGYFFFIQANDSAADVLRLVIDDGSDATGLSGTADVDDGRWHLLSVVGNRNGNAQFYVDGVASGSGSIASRQKSLANMQRLYIGGDNRADQSYRGVLDETRISTVARSADWIWATFQTMAHNAKFAAYQMQ